MKADTFLLLTSPGNLFEDVIHSRNDSLKVKVYNLNNREHIPNDSEIQLYGYVGNDLLLFETIDIVPEDALSVISAIKWYSIYYGCPEMEILPDDPRLDYEIAVAN